MANELNLSSIINGQTAIQSFSRNGLQIASNPIRDYIRFFRKGLGTGEYFLINYPKADLEVIHGLVFGVTYNWKIEFNDTAGIQYFSATVGDSYLSLPSLILPKAHTLKFTNLGDPLSYLIIVANQCYLLEDINLK